VHASRLFVDKGEGWPADPGSAEAMRTHLDHVFARLDWVMGDYWTAPNQIVLQSRTAGWDAVVYPVPYVVRYNHSRLPDGQPLSAENGVEAMNP